MKGIIQELLRRFWVWIYKKQYKQNNVSIHKRAYIDVKNCHFEGDNYVGDRTVLRNCLMGRGSYVADKTVLYDLKIGRWCSISSNVRIICGRHPSREFVSTHPAFFSKNSAVGLSFANDDCFEEIKYANPKEKQLVVIENDVWIGDGVAIMDGVTIANGTIVAAGAVVTKSTEPYSIVGGVPARVIRYRFERKQIDMLLQLEWWDKNEIWLKENAYKFQNIEMFLN